MGKYKIYHSDRFDEKLGKFDANFENYVDKIEEQLKDNPYTGKPLDTKWFREKKHGKHRIYFVVYEEFASVFMVAISEKKDQQKVITTVKLTINLFKEELRKIVDKDKLT